MEANVVINGVQLTEGQVMATRVAVETFLSLLDNKTYMEELGRIGPLYQKRLVEVETLLVQNR
jgi:hypothetical protein